MMLVIDQLQVGFRSKGHTTSVLDRVSFHIGSNEVVGLVGESGSGKSVTAHSIMTLLPPQAVISGDIRWDGVSIRGQKPEFYRRFLGKEVGMIFQNAQASLNPVLTIGYQLIETLRHHHGLGYPAARQLAIEWLDRVGLTHPETRLAQYPHEISLGMSQRVMIALTLAMSPRLLIADEPTASLDVTVQAQVLSLIDRLRTEKPFSVLFISHDLGVVAQFCDRLMVMYRGRIVESGTAKSIFASPKHPYTRALIDAIPVPDPSVRRRPVPLAADDGQSIGAGCSFYPRCTNRKSNCLAAVPQLTIGDHPVACFYPNA